MAEKRALLSDARGSTIALFKSSFSELELGSIFGDGDEKEDVKAQMKKLGINIDLIPPKEIKNMNDEELESYEKVINQMDAALSKLKAQMDKVSKEAERRIQKHQQQSDNSSSSNLPPV